MPNIIKVFSGNANPELAKEICEHLNISLSKVEVRRFSDGEIFIEIGENVRGTDVFVIQPTCTPVNDHLMELVIMVDEFPQTLENIINNQSKQAALKFLQSNRELRQNSKISDKLLRRLHFFSKILEWV